MIRHFCSPDSEVLSDDDDDVMILDCVGDDCPYFFFFSACFSCFPDKGESGTKDPQVRSAVANSKQRPPRTRHPGANHEPLNGLG